MSDEQKINDAAIIETVRDAVAEYGAYGAKADRYLNPYEVDTFVNAALRTIERLTAALATANAARDAAKRKIRQALAELQSEVDRDTDYDSAYIDEAHAILYNALTPEERAATPVYDWEPQPAAAPAVDAAPVGDEEQVSFSYHGDTPLWAANLLEAEYHIEHGNDHAALQAMLDYLMRKAGLEELRAWKEHMTFIAKGETQS